MPREAIPPEISEVPPRATPARYKAKIDRVSPLSHRDDFEHNDQCFLGISLENSNFERAKLIGILEWISRRFSRCTVLIGDSIHRITLETTRGLAPDVARDTALALGRDFVDRERAVLERFADRTRFDIVTCSELQARPAYAAHHAQLCALYRDDEAFRASVEAFGRQYHAKHGAAAPDPERARRIRRSSDYFLEEFAIFACLRADGIPVMVYPGSFSTLAEIADGAHPGAPTELRDLIVVSLHLRGRSAGPAERRNPAPAAITRGTIYRDVYAKRVDDQAVTAEAALVRGRIVDGALAFASDAERGRALADGIFQLDVPTGLALAPGDAFAAQFYRGPAAEPYGRFRELGPARFGDPLLGFHQRINQIEQFLLERRFWATEYPIEIARMGEAMTALSQQVLRSVLAHVGLPAAEWARATGGCTERAGSYHLTFNHYRPQLDGYGLSSHKDDGFLTILRTTAPGLEINRRDRWERVPVDPSCFVVNFGLSMEILTAASRAPVAAIMHRVSHQALDRSSFGHFTSSNCQPGADQGIYRYRPGHGLDRVCASRELIDHNDYEIYQGTERPEGFAP